LAFMTKREPPLRAAGRKSLPRRQNCQSTAFAQNGKVLRGHGLVSSVSAVATLASTASSHGGWGESHPRAWGSKIRSSNSTAPVAETLPSGRCAKPDGTGQAHSGRRRSSLSMAGLGGHGRPRSVQRHVKMKPGAMSKTKPHDRFGGIESPPDCPGNTIRP